MPLGLQFALHVPSLREDSYTPVFTTVKMAFSPLHIYLWPQNKQSLNFAKVWTEHNWRRLLTRGDAAHSLRSWDPCTQPPGCSHQTSPILFLLDFQKQFWWVRISSLQVMRAPGTEPPRTVLHIPVKLTRTWLWDLSIPLSSTKSQ